MVYFTVIIDIKSRKILSWRLSRTMQVGFCLDCAYEAFKTYGVPAIFNTDCGSQYTSKEYVQMLQSYDIQISMDGVGRCRDNIYVERTWRTLKYEWVFLRDYKTFEEFEEGLGGFVKFFNNERIYQGIGYKTLEEVYKAGTFPGMGDEYTKEKVVA